MNNIKLGAFDIVDNPLVEPYGQKDPKAKNHEGV